MDLKERVALVTGPAKGMGAEVTRALAREGADLVLVGRDTAAIEPVADEARGLGRRVVVARCDVTNPAEVDAAVKAGVDTLGRIDILVNIAGGTGPVEKRGWETTAEEFDEIVELNLKGCFLTMRAVLPGMMARRDGKICNVGGTFGMRAAPGRMAYSASKWGLRGMTKTFALEAGPYNINVNCVAPGMVEGPRFFEKVLPARAKRFNLSIADARKHYEENYALRRISTGEDVANAVVFLVSERSRQITGVDLPVDGGWAAL
jgi:NAD(P)-dependent dehydrogenase (short-subunit alcohol dehydrogenase family)